MLRRHLEVPGEAADVVAEVVDVAVDFRAPRLQVADDILERLHPVVTLVVDLRQPDQLEVSHPLLQLSDARVEVGAPVVRYNRGEVLGRRVVLQGREPRVDGVLALMKRSFRVVDALLQATPTLDGPGVHLLHLLEHFIERLGDDWIHRPPCSLEPGEVLVVSRR